ncbi:MAG: type IVB secretion system protein IcmH/DotU [Vicinamibacterales bacterium]
MADQDDPFLAPDPRQRPRPGVGRRAGSETFISKPYAPPRAQEAEPQQPLAIAAMAGQLGIGLNPLVKAASPILMLIGQLRGTLTSTDIAGLRRLALEEFQRFGERALAAGVQPEIMKTARYALCAALDETVLSTPWGSQSEWAQQPMLVALHREAWGGEKFFQVLEMISQDPAKHVDLMELQYLIIAFGFTGRYQAMDRGHEKLAALEQDLFRRIRAQRGAVDNALSLRWRGLEDRRNRLVRYVPWWVVGAAALAILAIIFTVYYTRLATEADPIHARLAQVGMEAFSAPAPVVPVKGPTLKQLLAPDESAGTLSVEEEGGRTRVTLRGADLFGSGSATLNAAYVVTLQHVAAALNKVPGRVVVVGHTDDQPIRSLQFHDNFELSRERAVSVASVLKQSLENPARLTWNGVGASDPRFRPESDPENRARNRRVEIIHVGGV